MRRILPLSLALLLCQAPIALAAPGHVLEFGPYVGHFDFDALSRMEDGFMAGIRVGVHSTPWLNFEMEFDEVYTSRHISNNAARQITLAGHARFEPWRRLLTPSLLLGAALVAYDDEDDPDAYGDAYDLGFGIRWAPRSDWRVRADWLLRAQSYRIYETADDGSGLVTVDDEPVTLYSRALRLGVVYVF